MTRQSYYKKGEGGDLCAENEHMLAFGAAYS